MNWGQWGQMWVQLVTGLGISARIVDYESPGWRSGAIYESNL